MIFFPLDFSICGSHDPATHYDIASRLGLETMDNDSGLPSSVTLESTGLFGCPRSDQEHCCFTVLKITSWSWLWVYRQILCTHSQMTAGRNERSTRKPTFQWSQLSSRSFPHTSFSTTVCSHVAMSNYKGVQNCSLVSDTLLPQITLWLSYWGEKGEQMWWTISSLWYSQSCQKHKDRDLTNIHHKYVYNIPRYWDKWF